MESACAFSNNICFSDSLKYGRVPDPSSISFEGYTTNYHFDTGITHCKQIVETTFSYGIVETTKAQKDYFVAIGLNSMYDNNPPRQDLKIVFLLDISGSMSDSFRPDSLEGAFGVQCKLDVAKTTLTSLFTNQLRKDDYFSIVAFDTKQDIVLPLGRVGDLSTDTVIQSLSGLQPRGGTLMPEAIEVGFEMLINDQKESNAKQQFGYRVFVLTDMNTSLGNEMNTPNQLYNRIDQVAQKYDIYVSYIGIGLDFNTSLASQLSGIKGGNYFAVESEKEFQHQMQKNFDYMVSPIAFDATVEMKSQDFELLEVLGVPGAANHKAKEMIFMKNLFPSGINENGLVQGGIILAKMKRISSGQSQPYKIEFQVNCIDFTGQSHSLSSELIVNEKDAPFYESNGIHKAILLYQHMNLCLEVIKQADHSDSLFTSIETKKKVKEFHDYFVQQMELIEDPGLAKELDVLIQFLNAPDSK